MDWYFKVLRNYIGFGGRARRKEYWLFHLVNFILAGVLSVLDKMLGLHIAKDEGALTTIYTVLVFLPLWAVQFRRLARHRPLSLVAVAAVNPDCRLADYSGIQLPGRYAGNQPLRARS